MSTTSTGHVPVKASPSPRQGPTRPEEEPQLPQGQCRFILLQGEAKGQRCPCVNFFRNRGIPGSTCDCGHQACYHSREPELSEVDFLKRRILALEDRLAQATDDDKLRSLVIRVSGMEDEMERNREEFGQEIKRAYSNTTPLWASYHQLQRQMREHHEQLALVTNHSRGIDVALKRLDDRQLELQDADISLEERIENIVETLEEEDLHPLSGAGEAKRRRRSTSDTHRPIPTSYPLGLSSGLLAPSLRLPMIPRNIRVLGGRSSSRASPHPTSSMPSPPETTSVTDGLWTVHVSLMPHTTIPMPFERHTNAYQRCLSRGLHRVIPVRGSTAQAFSGAVQGVFGHLLKGRPWMPMQARLCDAQQLQGLPMLRPLEAHLMDRSYTADFLLDNCAVCDQNGTMDSLYITMREPHVLSWHALRHAPVVVEGLEESWEYDPLLDNDPYDDDIAVDEDERPAAGDILPSVPLLKRKAKELNRSASFGSAASAVDGLAATRAKRACPLTLNPRFDIRKPGVGAA